MAVVPSAAGATRTEVLSELPPEDTTSLESVVGALDGEGDADAEGAGEDEGAAADAEVWSLKAVASLVSVLTPAMAAAMPRARREVSATGRRYICPRAFR
ncbi:hypothetical protein GCM10010193_21150 [Kitasatospora atroaurantiaca]